MRRTRPRVSRVLFVLSAALAAGATMIVEARLRTLETMAAAAGPRRPVVVAAMDLDRGAVLDSTMVESREAAVRLVPPGALRSTEDVMGRVLGGNVVAGEPLTSARLAPAGGPVAALVPPGLRAIGVPSSLPPSAIRPGDRIEVHATFASGQPHTETVVTGAEVVSVLEAASFGSETPGGPVLVILVGPETAERLAFARTFADLSVAVVATDQEAPHPS
jgi:pilus assembly protein CpaB